MKAPNGGAENRWSDGVKESSTDLSPSLQKMLPPGCIWRDTQDTPAKHPPPLVRLQRAEPSGLCLHQIRPLH